MASHPKCMSDWKVRFKPLVSMKRPSVRDVGFVILVALGICFMVYQVRLHPLLLIRQTVVRVNFQGLSEHRQSYGG